MGPPRVCATPVACVFCEGRGVGDILIGRFRTRDYGHARCRDCGITFDTNVNAIAEEPLTAELIATIDSDERFRDVFVETWDIGADGGDVYPAFDWEDNSALRSGVAEHAISALREHLPPEWAGQIADVGCGDGFTTVELAKVFGSGRLLALDPSPTVLELPERDGIAARQGTLHSVQLPSDSLDAVVIIGNWMLHPDPAATLAECRRILRPGGVLVADYKDVQATIRRIAAAAFTLFAGAAQESAYLERTFVSMRYGLHPLYVGNLLRHLDFELLDSYGKPPRLLEFANRSEYQSGLAGFVWRVTDRIDVMVGHRAWVQFVARRQR